MSGRQRLSMLVAKMTAVGNGTLCCTRTGSLGASDDRPSASAWSAPAVRAWWLTAGHAVRVARHHHRAAATAERTLALTGRIGNPSHSGVESGFATITETVLDKDYFLMATYTKDQQAIQSVRDSQENPKLVSDTSLEAEAKLVDSGAVGVGGRSLHAYRGTPAQLSATEIERTLSSTITRRSGVTVCGQR